jgi:RNA-directed DNA polymerase
LKGNFLKYIRHKKELIKDIKTLDGQLPYESLHEETFQLWYQYFLSINTPLQLAELLDVERNKLNSLINQPQYFSYRIPKKKGGFRSIEAPEPKLKKAQKILNFFLQAAYAMIRKDYVFGFVANLSQESKTCNIAQNARVHVGMKEVLNIDLKDFFPSIKSHQVYEVFKQLLGNENEEKAIACTLLCTYEGKLPTGAPTSPILSNFVCVGLDDALQKFAKINYLKFTRYADDLTFSSSWSISDNQVLDIIGIIHQHGFSINEQKLRKQLKHRQQKVTGLVVNEKVNVDRRFYKKTRAMLHDLNVNGVEHAAKNHFKCVDKPSEKQLANFINKLDGYINFIGQVRGKKDAIFLGLKKEFEGAGV